VRLERTTARAAEGAGNGDMARALYRDIAAFDFNSVQYALVRKGAIEKSS
jgi:hypothetical protein